MADNINQYSQLDLSGGVQVLSSHLLRRRNEVVRSKNAVYNEKIGAAKRRMGYEKVAETIEPYNDSLGFEIFRSGQNTRVVVGINNTADTAATLRVMDAGNFWTTLLSNAAVDTRFQMLNDMDELYVAGATDTDVYMPLTNIDGQMNVSTSHNVYTAPRSKFIAEYQGSLYAINCFINGKYYRNRFYYSSPLLGYITLVQTDQKGLLQQLRVNSVQYIKVGMSLDIYTGGTEAKIQSSITVISVDKKNNRFSFAPTAINVADNDEIWLTGTKGTLSRFWNVDWKTPETADWEQVPPSKEDRPTFTGWGKNNNRLFLATRNSFLKWDGANLITVNNGVGCVSHETIQNVGNWTLFLHDTGVWGFNDNSGDFKLLSRPIDAYIKAITQTNLARASAGVVGKVYKLAVGEINPIEGQTTSTSTSSTSTSSTSTSTSSTSTSSTSTSSTSLSTSVSTTSTSTSSTSTSTTSVSTSTSATTISTSTSSTSTSTTTVVTGGKKVLRLCYDFDMNCWWTEEHKREIRYQRMHSMHGYRKPYFTDETGRLFRDETGNLDNNDPIPLEVEIGRSNMGTDQIKRYMSVLVDSEAARGGSLQYSLDGKAFKTLGKIVDNVQMIPFPQNNQMIESRDIDFKFVHNEPGDPPVINGLTTYFTVSEVSVNG
jgi:hypothetical protein